MATKLIAHSIHKNQRADKATVQHRHTLNTADEFAERFLNQMRAGITQKNPSAGKFRQPLGEKAPLQSKLMRLAEENSDESFISFSKAATDHLAKLIEKVPLATGGYLVFAQHNHGPDTFLLILLLSTRAQATFNDRLELTASPVIDFEHLRHAARFNMGEIDENPDGVVQFISREASETANYFLDFLACEKVIDGSQQGRHLYTALREISTSTGRDFEEVGQTAYTYWRSCRRDRKPMQLTSLANLIAPDNPNALLDLLGNEKYRLAGEFSPPPPNVMNRFVKFSYSKEKLKLEFDKTTWLDNISVGTRSITIRQAPVDLMEELKTAQQEAQQAVKITR